jgi:hypothetical protein
MVNIKLSVVALPSALSEVDLTLPDDLSENNDLPFFTAQAASSSFFL